MTKLRNDFDKWHFKGIKLHQVCTPFKSDGIEINNIVKFCENKRLPLFIHLYSNKEAIKLLNVVKKYLETNFILLHLIGLEAIVKQGKNINNIHYEISPYSYINEDRLSYAIDTCGSDHIILGSDTPWEKDSLRNNIARVGRLNIGINEKECILGNNIKDILNL
jgi:predicted TIM-barrel fold metal-dependent hydrolase